MEEEEYHEAKLEGTYSHPTNIHFIELLKRTCQKGSDDPLGVREEVGDMDNG